MEIPENQREIYETAKEVLENLLDLMDLPSTVVMSDEFTVIDEDGNASSIGLNIEGDDLGILIDAAARRWFLYSILSGL